MEQPTLIRILESDTNKKGDLFGRLMADLFVALGYEQPRLNVHKSGRELDLMADHRLESLDAEHPSGDGETLALVDRIPDLKALSAEDQTLLAMDIDKGLEQLTPQQREVRLGYWRLARHRRGDCQASCGGRRCRCDNRRAALTRCHASVCELLCEI